MKIQSVIFDRLFFYFIKSEHFWKYYFWLFAKILRFNKMLRALFFDNLRFSCFCFICFFSKLLPCSIWQNSIKIFRKCEKAVEKHNKPVIKLWETLWDFSWVFTHFLKLRAQIKLSCGKVVLLHKVLKRFCLSFPQKKVIILSSRCVVFHNFHSAYYYNHHFLRKRIWILWNWPSNKSI